MPSAKKTPELLSIGELAQATGISPDTIRVWERRYGVPEPVRLPSGHRRYTPEQLRWLRRVVEAVSLGHRPSSIVKSTEEELQELLDNRRTKIEPPDDLDSWLELVRTFDAGSLTNILRDAWQHQAPSDYLTETIAPLELAVNRAFNDGELKLRHRQFVGELLQDVLRSLRTAIGAPTSGPKVVLAGLEEDYHELPVQMAALLCAAKGVLPQLLGRNTPFEEIQRAAVEMRVNAVALPTAPIQCTPDQESRIEALRDSMPDHIHLCVGWHDARFTRRPRRGVTVVRELAEFELWLRHLL
ncbi:MAG: MerR family transcriptional regulator [Planctomycetota bacterium]